MAEQAGDNTRTYKVLRYDESALDSALVPVGEYVAGSDRRAVREAIKEHGFGRFVAVAESNWHEHEPSPDPEPRIRWAR